MNKRILIAIIMAVLSFTFFSVSAQKKGSKTSNDLFDVAGSYLDSLIINYSSKTIKWEEIPTYTIQVTNVVNEDGSVTQRAFLVDNKGNKRSPETVKAVQKVLYTYMLQIANNARKSIATILLKGKVDKEIQKFIDQNKELIARSIAIRKQLKKEKKMLQQYEKNFTVAGVPVDAKVDLSGFTIEEKTMSNEEYVALQEKYKNGVDKEAIDDFFED